MRQIRKIIIVAVAQEFGFLWAMPRSWIFYTIKHPNVAAIAVANCMGYYLRGFIPDGFSVVDVGMERMREFAEKSDTQLQFDREIKVFVAGLLVQREAWRLRQIAKGEGVLSLDERMP